MYILLDFDHDVRVSNSLSLTVQDDLLGTPGNETVHNMADQGVICASTQKKVTAVARHCEPVNIYNKHFNHCLNSVKYIVHYVINVISEDRIDNRTEIKTLAIERVDSKLLNEFLIGLETVAT